ncbi:MAG: hypothetical protein JW958_10240 [Candidatus Eisenbacteria bacterium]|nr:hypothetical protein [Candidatus Eisenbacteria bacterium]
MLVIIRMSLVFAWAIALALLVPFFFLNYGGRWLLRVAEHWPLTHP